MKGENITIYDIANEAGVSPATVSRIMNGTANVAAEKRERVKTVMDKYSFVPSAVAKNLSSRESKTLGILLSDIRNPFYSSFYVALEVAAVRRGYNVILCNALNDEDIEKQQLEMLVNKGVDVIIACGGRTDTLVPDDDQVAFMNAVAQKVPVVVVGTANYFPCSRITTDIRPAMEALMGYLIGLGHRDFAILGGLSSKTPTREKQELFQEILKRNGLNCREEWIVETPNYQVSDGYEAGKRFFRRQELPTAILGMNESIALGIIRAASEANLRVPEDLSVVGFDNTYMAELCTPPLTSAGCMYDEYGETLMELVYRIVTEHEIQPMVTVSSGLTVRKSCAKPAIRKMI